MFPRLLARLRESLTQSERSTHARDVILPLLIISIALGGLAWRAWQLSREVEHGAKTLAMQYAGDDAGVTARPLDPPRRNPAPPPATSSSRAGRSGSSSSAA